MKKIPLAVLAMALAFHVLHAEASDAGNSGDATALFKRQMLDVLPPFPEGTSVDVPVSTTTQFSPSKGPWSTTRSEDAVFLRAFQTVDLEGRPVELRIGKGGQLYSIESPIGQLVPPQWRHADHNHESPWNDEVWQTVGVTSGRIFVHQSGCYVQKGEPAFYTPCLGQLWSPEDKAFTVLSWGIVPQVKSAHVSGLLNYTRYRFAAPGVLEVTCGLFDFGKENYSWLNTPWGGVRLSALGELWLSDKDQPSTAKFLNPRPRFGATQAGGAVDMASNTGGWMAFAEEKEDPQRYSLGLTFGRDDFSTAGIPSVLLPRQQTILRFGQAGGTSDQVAKATRNYMVAVVIPKLGVASGRGIWWRYYLVFGGFNSLKERCAAFAEKTYGGELLFPSTTPQTRTIAQCRDAGEIPREALLDAGLAESTELQPWPRPGFAPVFAFQLKKDASWIVSVDPSRHVAIGEKDKEGRDLYSVPQNLSDTRLLGFAPISL